MIQDAQLLDEARRLPVAESFERAGFEFQTIRYLCGPTSVYAVLRSFGDEVDRRSLLGFGWRVSGTTLDQLAHVVTTRGRRRATILRDLSPDAFRAELAKANDPARRVIVNFHRGPLFGWGGGHHSPLGGWLASRDLALVLDVNRRVGPWLVEADRMHAAVATIDPATRKPRGLLVIE